jgi:hypothetical protein
MSPTSFIWRMVAAALLIHLPAHAQSSQEIIKAGDAFDRKLDARKALPIYLEAEKLDPKTSRFRSASRGSIGT